MPIEAMLVYPYIYIYNIYIYIIYTYISYIVIYHLVMTFTICHGKSPPIFKFGQPSNFRTWAMASPGNVRPRHWCREVRCPIFWAVFGVKMMLNRDIFVGHYIINIL